MVFTSSSIYKLHFPMCSVSDIHLFPSLFHLHCTLYSGENYTYDDADMKSVIEDGCSGDLSTSSLRRKLFFHGDVGTPLSPVR